MSFSGKRRMFLLTWTILCAAVISCKPEGTPTMDERPLRGAAGGRAEMGRRTLSKGQIIAAANAAVRRLGKDPNEFDVTYDEGNAIWISTAYHQEPTPKPLPPQLQGHDYQVVMYRPRALQFGGGLWVFIDRNTGEELYCLRWM